MKLVAINNKVEDELEALIDKIGVERTVCILEFYIRKKAEEEGGLNERLDLIANGLHGLMNRVCNLYIKAQYIARKAS